MKKVLITGGTRGIGRACAELFNEKGYEVYVTYLKSDDKAQELEEKGIKALKADVSDPAAVMAVYEKVGGVDVLVNNAGISWYGLLTDMDFKEWERIFSVNVHGIFNCVKAFSPDMVRKKCGTIINISSMWGITGASCEVAYSSTKAAVIGFTKALAKELAPSGIRVNCVAPGAVDTDMMASFSDDEKKALCEEIPLSCIGNPLSVAEAVMYLCNAEYVTGEVLNVNGGMVI